MATDLTTALASGLTYTWSTVKMPSGAKSPGFSVNGTHAANTTTAFFSKDGTYRFRVTVKNTDGHSVTSDVDYVVKQKARGLRITPHGAKVKPGATLQLTTIALDQFAHPLRGNILPDYTIAKGSGSIDASTGLFQAAGKAGIITIDVTLDDLTGTIDTMVT